MRRLIRKTGSPGFALVVTALACAAVLGLSSARSAGAESHPQMSMTMQRDGGITARQLALRNGMRALWEQHVAWTRLAIVSFAGNLPDLQATEQRLLRNQDDIGDAIAPVYGQAAGKQLTALLRQHILIAVQILVDAKSGDQPALTADTSRWYTNANQIAGFLHAANPHSWPLATMRQMMHRHLQLTTQEAVAQLTGDYPASIHAYDQVEQEILSMADMLSTGIIHQFPGRFS